MTHNLTASHAGYRMIAGKIWCRIPERCLKLHNVRPNLCLANIAVNKGDGIKILFCPPYFKKAYGFVYCRQVIVEEALD